MHTPTIAPQPVEDRKPVKVKIDGHLNIRLVTLADRLGFTVEGLLRSIVENGCDIAEARNQTDITNLLFGSTENGAS